MSFVHLYNQTQFSLLDGAMRPDDLANRAAELEMGAIALTDTCNMYGAVAFHKAAKKAGVQPIYGSTIWVWPDGLDDIHHRKPDGGFHLGLLIEGGEDAPTKDPWIGYRNLCQLITSAIFDGMHYRPRIDWAMLEAHKQGLIVMTRGLNGPIRADATGETATARAHLQRILDIVGPDHLFVELIDTGIPGQGARNTLARELAAELGLQTVVTNASQYLQPTDAVTLDLLNCVARGTPVDHPDRKPLATDQHYIKSEAEMRDLFPKDGAALDRTVEIAKRCRFTFQTDTYHFPATEPPDPDPPCPEGVEGAEAPRADTDANWIYFYEAFLPPEDFITEAEARNNRPAGAGSINGFFEWFSRRGLERRFVTNAIDPELHGAYRERLEVELRIIENMGFPAYLLIVAEFINWAKAQGIPVGPGRGSAAGSITAWAQRITDIDPMRFSLLFERFLNPERVSMPDIDVDFCQDRREEVIEHVREKYGSPLVSQIITYGKLQAKAAIKDVARVCGVEFNQADRIAKLVPNELNIKLEAALLEEKFRTLVEGDPQVGRIVNLARRVEGMTRQTGVHAAGVVVADRPLVEHAPLYRDGPEGGPVVQYDMKSAESIGLIKFDFLGLKTLDQLRDAVAMIHRNTGELVDLTAIPTDDEATFKLLQRGDSLAVFQVESSGMRDLLQKLRPTTLDDLIALIALFRPGPMQLIPTFIDRKHGREPITYELPELEPILSETYGVIVYQEQVMQIAQRIGGYSLGEADMLRRAMGKKIASEMAAHAGSFVEGAERLGFDRDTANHIFTYLEEFAKYGFNKSHSAAYGFIGYQTAYLKAHHRAEYMAAVMSVDASNTDKVLAYIGDCKRAGLDILPPDVNHSVANFDVHPDNRQAIRFGLAAVKGVGEGAVQAIIEAREEAGGAFEGFMDCLERIDHRRVNKKVIESCVKCGAFDWTGQPRSAMFKVLASAISVAQKAQELKASGQTSLFGAMSAAPPPSIRIPDIAEWHTAEKLRHERDALGFFITGHPIEAYADIVNKVASCPIAHLEGLTPDKEVAVAGMISTYRAIRTKRGSKMCFATIEDIDGAVECVFFSEPFARSERVLAAQQPVLIRGKLEKNRDGGDGANACKILAESAELLSEVRERRARQLHLVLEPSELENGQLSALKELIGGSPGSCPVHIHLRNGEAWTTIRLPPEHGVVVDEPLMQGLESLFRRRDVARLA